jgi:transcriptional regulator with XRE-family HTH domain
MRTFAELLRDARERAGISQRELAEKVGVDSSYISRIERALFPPPVRDKVLAIADALELSNPAERAMFLLSAGCASIEELEGLVLLGVIPAQAPEATVSSPVKQRRRPSALASPELPTVGEQIDAILEQENLSREDEKTLTEVLVSHIRQLTNMLKLSRGDKSDETKM